MHIWRICEAFLLDIRELKISNEYITEAYQGQENLSRMVLFLCVCCEPGSSVAM